LCETSANCKSSQNFLSLFFSKTVQKTLDKQQRPTRGDAGEDDDEAFDDGDAESTYPNDDEDDIEERQQPIVTRAVSAARQRQASLQTSSPHQQTRDDGIEVHDYIDLVTSSGSGHQDSENDLFAPHKLLPSRRRTSSAGSSSSSGSSSHGG
jgi:hypothetical protein